MFEDRIWIARADDTESSRVVGSCTEETRDSFLADGWEEVSGEELQRVLDTLSNLKPPA